MAYGAPSPGSPELPPSMKERLRSIFLPCCSGGRRGGGEESRSGAALLRSSSAWVRARAQELPEMGERWRILTNRVASGRGAFGPSSASGGGFKYDPLSYALNFDEGSPDDDDEAPLASADDFRRHHVLSPLPPRAAAANTFGVKAG